jgi:hypothetical protein
MKAPGVPPQARVLVAPELRHVDMNPPTDSPFGRKLPTLDTLLDWLRPPKRMPVLTAWGLLAERAYPWTGITSVSSRTTGTATGVGFDPLFNSYENTRPERTSHVEFLVAGGSHRLSGPFMAMLEGLPQLLPRYQWLATRPLALDLAGTVPLPRGPGGFGLMLEAAREAARPLLETVSGYRASRTQVSARGRALLAGALETEPERADPGMLATVIAGLFDARELADAIGRCILSPHALFAATAQAAAGKLGLGPIVTGQASEIAPFLDPSDAAALRTWW